MRRAVRVLLALVSVTAVLFLFAFPVRTLIEQRDQTALAQKRIKGLSAENAALTKEAAALQTDAVIEELARERYGLQMPGDNIFTVLPASGTVSPATTVPVSPAVPRGG